MYVNGNLYPDTLRTTTFQDTLSFLFRHASLPVSPMDQTLSSLDAKELYEQLYKITFPQEPDIDNDDSYLLPLQELSDAGYYFFVLAEEKEIRILVGRCKEGEDPTFLDEVVLELTEYRCMNDQLQKFYQNTIP